MTMAELITAGYPWKMSEGEQELLLAVLGDDDE